MTCGSNLDNVQRDINGSYGHTNPYETPASTIHTIESWLCGDEQLPNMAIVCERAVLGSGEPIAGASI